MPDSLARSTAGFRGPAFTARSCGEVDVLDDHLFCVDDAGMITGVWPAGDPAVRELVAQLRAAGRLTEAGSGEYFLPGFVDLHVHAPQWPQAGTALDRPLNDWLHSYTFPLEARFADLHFAGRVYQHLVRTLLSQATTTALYFATVHVDASLVLAEVCARLGQRGLVGKVVMDDPQQCPHYYRDADARAAIGSTQEFVERVQQLRTGSRAEVYPVITPRFVPSCTDEALAGLGELAARYGVHVQSHCSESDWEHQHVLDRFGRSDTEVLDGFGLLTEQSVLAHCTHLSQSDAQILVARGAAIAHCPLSNVYFSDAIAPVRRYLDAGVQVGLGTDLSGGYSPSMAHAIRHALVSSRVLRQGVDARVSRGQRGTGEAALNLNEAFWLATAGGGEALSLPIGRLAPGYSWDAQLVATSSDAGLPVFDDSDPLDLLARIILVGGPEQIRRVWVAGREVVC